LLLALREVVISRLVLHLLFIKCVRVGVDFEARGMINHCNQYMQSKIRGDVVGNPSKTTETPVGGCCD
jgi:hypothetical protein